MAAKNIAKQRRQRTKKKADAKQKEDRLSSLPDDILIGIIAHLPLPQAIATGSLSRRWLGLWTNRTTIQLSNRNYDCLLEFFIAFDDIMTYITSPVLRSFRFELVGVNNHSLYLPSFDSKLKQICERNVRELKVTFRVNYDGMHIVNFPGVVFQMQSLVSVEFCSTIGWQLPESINLPKLKNLTLYLCPSNCKWFEKLTQACPSLEEVSLSYEDHNCVCWPIHFGNYNIECSNRNLRRLFINLEKSEYLKFRINAPKIELLSVRAPKSTICTFGKVPIVLREANIELTGVESPAKVDYELMAEFYKDISNARVLSLHVFAIDNFPTTLLRKATNLTLDTKLCNDVDTKIALSSFQELCPKLDALTLKFSDFGKNSAKWILPKPSNVSTLPQGLKTIVLETHWYAYCKPVKSFLQLIRYFLSEATYLEHFKFDARGSEDLEDFESVSVERKQKTELMFCNLLFHCPTTSLGCEVEFVGRFFRMSRKSGPKVTSSDGEVIPFSRLPRHIFNPLE